MAGFYGGGEATSLGNGFVKVEVTIPYRNGFAYLTQRVTVINVTTQFRWSADVPRGGSGKVTIVGRATDRFQVIRNLTTYGVINLFGYGIGMYDLNAIESNSITEGQPGFDATYEKVTERVLITKGEVNPPCDPAPLPTTTCNAAASAAAGVHCPPADLSLSPESDLGNGKGTEFVAWALDANRGVVELRVTPQREDTTGIVRPAMCDRKNYIILGERIATEAGFQWFAHPRLNVLKRLYRARSGRDPVARFTSISSFKRGVVRYGLVAGFQYGIPVVRLDPEVPLGDASLVDVIWIPAGAQSVRVLEGDQLATVVDGKGRVLLIDLTNIDESKEVDPLPLCGSITCESELFPTVAKALNVDVADAGPGEVGADDPRIVWKSEEDTVKGTLPPLIDSETGFVYTGNVNDKKMRVLSAVDPRLRLISEPRDVQPLELRSIVPLGIKRPRTDETAAGSLASFRIEVALPGSISESLSTPLNFAVESERVWGGVVTDPTSDLLPIHLRNVTLTRMVPAFAEREVVRLRYQRGWNRFVSAPIVALADPRAAKDYHWFPGANKAAEGCHDCDRPVRLQNDTSVKEILTAGRLLSIRPEGNVFSGTDYAYLTEQGRLTTRVETVPADTIRSSSVLVSAQDPPVAEGAIQETLFVHSGEVSSSAIDLDAEGRAGLSVVIDRTYASRTIGVTPFGYGWTSSMFEHLRPMPGGEIEYHDTTGEVWTFAPVENSTVYRSPLGLFLKLARHDGGWMLSDQQFNFAYFDALGRLSARADRFADPKEVSTGAKKGNAVYYLYDVSGRLIHVVDPVGRRTTLRYDQNDLVSEVEDWRGRKVTYAYDAGRLVSVKGPEVQSAEGFSGRPETRYGYEPAGAGLTAHTDFAANLKTIKDPGVSAARVTFEYDVSSNAAKRDRATSQTWATGETAQFEVTQTGDGLAKQVAVTDALGQKRIYELSGLLRRHVAKTTLENVPVFERDESLAQAPLNAEAEPQALVAEVLERNPHGQVTRMKSPHDLETTLTPEPARGGAVGTRIKEIVQKLGQATLAIALQFDVLEGASNNPSSIGRAANGATPEIRDSPVATRNRPEVSVTDDDVKTVQKYDIHGQLLRAAQQAATGSAETGVQEHQYYDASAAPIARGRIKSITRPDGAVSLLFTYATTAQGGDRTTITDTSRDTVTTLDRDPRGLPTRRAITKNGTVLNEETFAYDANGLLKVSTRQQEKLGEVVTRVAYDDMLRETEVSTTQARVGGSPATVTAKTAWNLSNRTITRTDPFAGSESAAAKEITTLDPLGRTAEIKRVSPAGDAQTLRVFRYDRQGQRSYETDRTRWGIVRIYDPFGRQTLSVDSRMQRHETKWTAWDHPEIEHRLDGGLVQQGGTPAVVGNVKRIFTRNGQLRAVNEELIADTQFRSTRFGWSNGGRETSVRMGPVTSLDEPLRADTIVRLTERHVDAAGRTTDVKVGEGRGIAGPFTEFGLYGHTETASKEYTGMLPSVETVREPRTGATFSTTHDYDGLGRPATTVAPGGYEIQRTFDEAGNVLSTETSGRGGLAQARYDSRGLVIEQIHPDSTSIAYQYDALGNLTKYRDEQQKETTYETDGLGRIVKAKYPDGTCEATIFEIASGLTAATRDRAGQWLVYRYAGYLIDELRLGPFGPASECTSPITAAPSSEEVFLKYGYDLANRVVSIRSATAGVEWADFDRGGRPHTTRSIRYKNGTGLTTGEILDVHSQRHVWSIFDGERARYRMPVPGTTVAQNASSSAWRSWIEEQRDAVGNVVAQKAIMTETGASVGPFVSQAFARGIGRLASRERPLTGGASLKALYGYAESTVVPPAPDVPTVPSAPGPRSGLMGRAEFSVGAATIAGNVVTRDTARRVSESHLVGLGSRFSRFDYDDRDRLTESILAALPQTATAPTIAEVLDPADFRTHRTVTRLSADERSTLGAATAREIELPSFVATPNDSHQIERVDLDGPDDLDFVFSGGRRTSDGLWNAKYDPLGRLVQLTRIAPKPDHPVRFEYDYNPMNRLVARRVCTNTDANPCGLETRTNVLARDGLPAHTTFVWDPVTDRLLSIFEAEKSTGAGADEYAGLQRQYIHGDRAYDDPIVVTSREGSAVKTYIPVIDEAATGNLIAVLDDDGVLVERVFNGDSYGASPRYLHGPVVQRMTRKVTRNDQGQITEVVLTVNLSDAVRADTLVSGTVLRSVAGTSTAGVSSVEPTLEATDPHTLRWTLNAAQWNALAKAPGATAIEIAITKDLRAVGWGEAEVLSLPDWLRTLATGLGSNVAEPLAHRESIAAFEAATEQVATLWAISDLYLAASHESKAKVLTGFKAAPFIEPATGFALFRNRWYDPPTGTFLTPDPSGYVDSSNLYIGFAGDPVNNIDPTGECIGLDTVPCRDYAFEGAMQIADPRNSWGNLNRSARFLGLELKGAAFAIPRLVKGVYDLATHLPETAEALGNLATAVANDPVGMLNMAGNAIINADPDTVAEVTGETLFFAGLGAAAKTPQATAALRRSATAFRTWAATSEAAQDVIRQARQLRAVTRYGSRLGTASDEAFFWSGRSGGVGGEAVARRIAHSRGGVTLEELLETRGIRMPAWDPRDPNAIAEWVLVSQEYAQAASGNVRAVVGSSLRPGNVWETIELPALKANHGVRTITTIDPATGVARVIFRR